MIASLQGIIDAVSTDSMIVNVNGVGFKVGEPKPYRLMSSSLTWRWV